MKFYEIRLKSVPKINFALSVDIEKHKNRFNYIKGFLEICVIEKGCIVHKNYDGSENTVMPGMLSCVTSLEGFDSYSSGHDRQQHTTVGILADYSVTAHDTEKGCDIPALRRRMEDTDTILLPNMFYLEESFDRVRNAIKTISRLNLSPNPGDKQKAVGNWHILTGMLTDISLKNMDDSNKNHTPSEYVYAGNAIRYINEHYREKITVADIAQRLEISEGYLQRLFKSINGTSIITYINSVRINTAISLIKNRGFNLQEASYNVGIEDASYMSRLFKKVTGTSAREYLKKSETLYK